MITKFQTYNESRFFSKENDEYAKKLVDKIKKDFDINKLKKPGFQHFSYDDKYEIDEDGSVGPILLRDYFLKISGNEIYGISKYILKDLYKFFDKRYKNFEDVQKKQTSKNILLGETDLEDAKEF